MGPEIEMISHAREASCLCSDV